MPPKKKDPPAEGDGGGKKVLDETLDRDVLLVEVGAMRTKLSRSEQKCQQADSENRELQASLARQRDDQVDIFKFLNTELMHRTLRIDALEQEITEMRMQATLQKEIFENDLQAERNQNEETTKKLNERISQFEAKFVNLNEFIEKKDALEAELEETKQRLIKEQKEHASVVNDLERKAVQEKERLRKEMLAKINEAKKQFMKMTGNRLEVTTKRTIMENEQMNSELAFQSREAEKLLHKNEQLTLENKTMKRDLELYRQMEKELAKRNNAYLKTIRTLLAKLKALDNTKKEILENSKKKESDIVDTYQMQVANISMSLEEATTELDELREKYSDVHQRHKHLTAMHDEVMRFLMQCLEDVKTQIAKPSSESDRLIEELVPELSTPLPKIGLRTGDQKPRLDDLQPHEREKVLQYLLSKLRAFQVGAQQQPDEQQLSLPPIFPERPLNMSLNGIDLSAPLKEINNFLSNASVNPELRDHQMGMGEGGENAQQVNVQGEVRPWGQRAQNKPLSSHKTDTYLRRGQGGGGKVRY